MAYTCPSLGPLVPLFWISCDISSVFQSQSAFCLICFFFAEVNVIYIPIDTPLVQHMLISWWLAAQPVTSLHTSAEVGLRLEQAITLTEDERATIVPAIRPRCYSIYLFVYHWKVTVQLTRIEYLRLHLLPSTVSSLANGCRTHRLMTPSTANTLVPSDVNAPTRINAFH